MAVQSVCSWLESCKSVSVQEDWVEACVEWILQEEGSINLSPSSMREMVYEQWLHANLREVVSRPCIPVSVVEQQTTQISGQFIVQVESLMDVGAAAYAQLQKIKGQSLDNVESKKNFEPKPTRLLLMSLTDGITDFKAMEYRPISQLSTDILPGTKLLLHGTINCRLGTLLVTGDHVQVLGGGVDSLVVVNQQRRILARALNDDSLAGESGPAAGNTNSATVANSAQTSGTQQTTETVHIQQDNQQPDVGDVQIADLDLENFDDFEEQVIDQDRFQDAQEQWPEDVDFSPHDFDEERQEEEGEGRQGEGEMAECEEEEEEELLRDEEMLRDDTDTRITHPHSQAAKRTVGQKWRHSSYYPEESGSSVRPSTSHHRDITPQLSDVEMKADKRSRVVKHNESFVSQHDRINVSHSMRNQSGRNTMSNTSVIETHLHPFHDSVASDTSVKMTTMMVSATLSGSVGRKITVAAVRPLNSVGDRVNSEYQQRGSSSGGTLGSGVVPRGILDSGVVPSRTLGSGVVPSGTLGGGVVPSRTLGSGVVPSGILGSVSVPLVSSVSQAADIWTTSPLVRVKARFVRVTSKLRPCDGQWMVSVVMEDDSGGQLNVNLSNQVLERLIGFTAQEFVESIQPNKRDPAVKARGSKGFKNCQAYLATLDCFMEIRKPPTFGDLPVVERLLDTE